MNVPEIIEVKNALEALKSKNLILDWELPYENILTRRSAALFFLSFPQKGAKEEVWKALEQYEYFSFKENTEQLLSSLDYQITFNEEAKTENTVPQD